MRHSFRTLLLLSAVALLGASAFASTYTLDFDTDQLPYPGLFALIPDGYGQLNWTNEYYADGTLYPGTGYLNGIVSPNEIAFNGFAQPAEAVSDHGQTLSLDSGWFTSAYFTQVAEIDTYLNGNLTGAFVFPALFSQPTFIDFGGVLFNDMLIFSDPGSQLVIDNLTLDTASTTPEPGTILLLGGGALAALTQWRQRRA